MRTLTSKIPLLLAIGVVAHLAACSGDEEATNPYELADAAWISISGTVDSVLPDQFELDYGEGLVTVEMDDGDRDADAYKLLPGDKVTVHGMIDDDLFETTTIEASSVYVEKLGVTFYASAVDDEGSPLEYRYPNVYPSYPVEVALTVIEGTVTRVDPDRGEFVLSEGSQAIRVSVETLPFDPLDDEGYLTIERGDRVSVSGNMDSELTEGHVFAARTLVELSG